MYPTPRAGFSFTHQLTIAKHTLPRSQFFTLRGARARWAWGAAALRGPRGEGVGDKGGFRGFVKKGLKNRYPPSPKFLRDFVKNRLKNRPVASPKFFQLSWGDQLMD